MEIRYRPPGPVSREFILSSAPFDGIQGPVGSGKSSVCCMKIMKWAAEMPKGRDGVRRSRWAICRNTYPELRTTTIKTWLDWFPEKQFGRFVWTPPFTHYIKYQDIELEALFLALDKEEDVGKLLSLELTGAWMNEAREIPKEILDALTMRVGRFPSMRTVGEYPYAVLGDTNAPTEDHWWAIMSGQAPVPEWMNEDEAALLVKPEGWVFRNQPPAMLEDKDEQGRVVGYKLNPAAENLENLQPDYYTRIIQGKDPYWINVYVMNRIGTARAGKPVYRNFRREAHVAPKDFLPDPKLPILIGIDFGLTPAAIFCQRFHDLSWSAFDEITNRDMHLAPFAEQIRAKLAYWENHLGERLEYRAWGDPAGDARSPNDNRTAFDILRAHGVQARSAPSNDPVLRIDAVDSVLTTMVDGRPGLTVSPRCTTLIRGFEDGYRYQKKQTSLREGEKYKDTPEKNQYSHPHDAFQYVIIGEGVGRKLRRSKESAAQVVNARGTWSPYDRQAALQRRSPRLRSP